MLEISRLSKADFCYPLERPKIFGVDHPDISLLATIILVTRLLYPFNDDGRNEGSEPQSISMNWRRWQAIFDDSPTQAIKRLDRQDIAKLQSRDAWALTDDQIDDYLDWHQQFRMSEKQGTSLLCLTI